MDKLKTFIKLAINPKNWKTLMRDYRELVTYFIFGVLTTVVSFATYYVIRFIFPDADSVPAALRWIFEITSVFGVDSNTTLPVVISWIVSVTFAYVTNKIWVFQSKAKGFGRVVGEIAGFYAARLATLFIDMLMMFLLVDLPGISGWLYELFARCLVSGVVLVLNYVFSKLFVFRKKKESEREKTAEEN